MPEDEQFVQKRLLLACVLSAVAITMYTFVARPVAPVVAPETGAEPVTAEPVPGDPAEPSSEEALPQAFQPAAVFGTQAAESEQEIVVESDTFIVRFSNRGAVVTSWVLKEYVAADGEPLDLVHAGGAKNHGYPFGLALSGGQPVAEINQALFVVNDGFSKRSAPTTVRFEYSDGVHTVRKSFSFQSEGYLVEITSELSESGQARSHLLTWPGGFGDTAQPDDQMYSTTFYYDPSQRELLRNEAGDLEDGRITNIGPYPYVGIDDSFFTAAFMPLGSEMTVQLESSGVAIEPIATGTEATFAALAVGGAEKNQLQLFVGPKSYDTLASVRPELREIVNLGFGWSIFRWLSFLPRVDLLDAAMDARQVRGELRLGDHPGYDLPQFRHAAIEVEEFEIDEENAGLAAADQADQRKVQGPRPTGPQEGEAARRDDGPLQKVWGESLGRLPADAADDAFLLRLLQSLEGGDRNAPGVLVVGGRLVAPGANSDSCFTAGHGGLTILGCRV